MSILPKQIRIIKMAQRQIDMDDDSYRCLLSDMFGEDVSSCKQLTVDQANELIDEMKRKGFHLKTAYRRRVHRNRGVKRHTPRRAGNMVAMASQDELSKIDALGALIAWKYKNGQMLFLEKRMRIKSGKVRTADDAYQAIEGLKALFERQMIQRHGDDWADRWHDDPAIREYINIHKS